MVVFPGAMQQHKQRPSASEGYLRLSYATALEDIKVGVERLERFTKTLV